ncbi:MAG: choice-of-anchor V domain-containing protein [Pseudomonadota bacterium]
MRRSSLALAALTAAGTSAHAYPEGAPWGAANPLAAESCSTCHFDADATMDSRELEVIGLPQRVTPGEAYPLQLVLADETAVTAGFQIVVASDGDAGWFSAAEERIESEGAAIRSNEPTTVDDEKSVSWSFVWHVPSELTSPARFHAAATAANDDGSPLGDRVHYRTFIVAEERAAD